MTTRKTPAPVPQEERSRLSTAFFAVLGAGAVCTFASLAILFDEVFKGKAGNAKATGDNILLQEDKNAKGACNNVSGENVSRITNSRRQDVITLKLPKGCSAYRP